MLRSPPYQDECIHKCVPPFCSLHQMRTYEATSLIYDFDVQSNNFKWFHWPTWFGVRCDVSRDIKESRKGKLNPLPLSALHVTGILKRIIYHSRPKPNWMADLLPLPSSSGNGISWSILAAFHMSGFEDGISDRVWTEDDPAYMKLDQIQWSMPGSVWQSPWHVSWARPVEMPLEPLIRFLRKMLVITKFDLIC